MSERKKLADEIDAFISTGCNTFALARLLERVVAALRAPPSQTAREAIIEECAKVAENTPLHHTMRAGRPYIVAAIRALAQCASEEGE